MKKWTADEVHAFVGKAAASRSWTVNPDTDFRSDLEAGLLTNVNRYGYFLCPCRDTSGNADGDKDVLCPCKYSQADVDEYGHCYCALFLSKTFAQTGNSPSPIPERRP